MRNGLYSIQVQMLDGVKGRDSGILVLNDGKLLGGGPYFWSVGRYSVREGNWKGELVTNQHTPFADPSFVRCLAGRRFQPDFRARSTTTRPKFSARRWRERAASAFARC
jgi:hypothetical protein